MTEEEKPMTVKERMAALARASSGGNSAPTPGPPRGTATPPGTSVAERLSKMRRSHSPPPKPGVARPVTPPSVAAAPVNTYQTAAASSQGTASSGSSVADRIARLSAGSSSPPYAPCPSSQRPATSTLPSAISPSLAATCRADSPVAVNIEATRASTGRSYSSESTQQKTSNSSSSQTTAGGSPRVSAGLASRMQGIKIGNSSSTGSFSTSKDETASSPSAVPTSPSKSPGVSGRVSAGLVARMKAMEGGMEKQELLPTPTLASSASNSYSSSSSSLKMSPGLAARMKGVIPGGGYLSSVTAPPDAEPCHPHPGYSIDYGTKQTLEAASGAPSKETLSPSQSSGGGGAPGGAVGRAQKMGGISLLGMGKAVPIMMPGIMPAGGLAELKRRKQEAEKEASEGTEEDNAAAILSPEPVTDQKPGELQHANLSRATIPQRRRSRKAARAFKSAPAVAAVIAASVVAESKPPSAPETDTPLATVTVSTASITSSEAEKSQEFFSTSKPTTAEEWEEGGGGVTVDAADKMKSMLQAASAGVVGDDEDDEDWD